MRGLKTALGNELLKGSETNRIDEVTGGFFISGKRFKKKLTEIIPAAKKSGLLDDKEISRLKRIANDFTAIEMEMSAKPFPEGVLNDAPSKYLLRPAQVLAARLGGWFSQGSMGGSLQTANIASSEARSLVGKMTNDEARNLLVRAVQDEDVLKDLLTNATKLTEAQKTSLWQRLFDKAKSLRYIPETPVSAIVPAAISAGRIPEQQEQLTKFRELKQRYGKKP